MIYIEGYHIQTNVMPVDPDVGGGNNVGWTGNVVTALAATNNSPLTLHFDGTSEDGDVGAFQGVLDSTIPPGNLYRVWLVAKEIGTGLSWNTHCPSVLLFDANGKPWGSPQNIWGPNAAKNLTGNYDQYNVLVSIPANTQGDETPNSIGVWAFAPEGQGGGFAVTKTLCVDELIVEPLGSV